MGVAVSLPALFGPTKGFKFFPNTLLLEQTKPAHGNSPPQWDMALCDFPHHLSRAMNSKTLQALQAD